MNKLITALIVGAFAAGSAIAADTAKSTDAMKSADTAKYKDCMKKDASGKETMDQACKDKVDKAAKGTDTMKAPEKGGVPTGSDGKAAPKK
jgi:pentapeptide MXKDX repeat protein